MSSGIVRAVAPTRICDIGGWTDTWFARHGRVCNIGVTPYLEVRVSVQASNGGRPRVALRAEDLDDDYSFEPGEIPGRHPLLEATVAEIGVPPGRSVDITVHSHALAGSSTGTSAASVVALAGALSHVAGRPVDALEIARTAHRIETERLGIEAGVQDHLCAAFGGLNYIEIQSYPTATITPISVSESFRSELERRLVLVYLGRAHVSSDVHRLVIEHLGDGGRGARHLEELRHLADMARDALVDGDLYAFGRTMTANTESQRQLHPSLVSGDADLVASIAQTCEALGWKVNGAGGDGGSVTVLCGPGQRGRRRLMDEVRRADPAFRAEPVSITRQGLRVWEVPS